MYSKPLLIQRSQYFSDQNEYIFMYIKDMNNKTVKEMFKIFKLLLKDFNILEIPIYN